MSSNLDLITNQANKVFFGVDNEQSEVDVVDQINLAKQQLVELMERYNALKHSKNHSFEEDHFRRITDLKPYVKFSVGDNSIYIDMVDYPMHYLIGTKQEAARNGAVVLVGTPKNRASVCFNKSRLVTKRNMVSTTTRYALHDEKDYIESYMDYLSIAKFSDDQLEKLESTYYTANSDLSHPHAQGTQSNFTSTCFGNNKWVDSYTRARSLTDYVDVIRRAILWFESANLADMYGSHSIPYIKTITKENAYPQEVRHLVESSFRTVITKVYKDAYDYANGNSEKSFAQLMAGLNELDAEALGANLSFSFDGKEVLSTTIMPFLKAVVSARYYQHYVELKSAPENVEATSQLFTEFIYRLNSMYAAWLLSNTHYLSYEKDCMYSDMRYLVSSHLSAENKYAKLSMDSINKLLCAPLALKDINPSAPDFLNFM